MEALRTKEEGGYTLIETLVAVLILTLAIAAPLSIASKVLFASATARDQVTAFYLAQEAIESVRFIRDNNGLNGASWLTGLPVGADFTIDAVNLSGSSPTIASCTGACAPINYDSSTKLFQYSPAVGTNTPSPFTRTVRIDTVNGNEVRVSVTISWYTGALSRSFVARENLLSWQ